MFLRFRTLRLLWLSVPSRPVPIFRRHTPWTLWVARRKQCLTSAQQPSLTQMIRCSGTIAACLRRSALISTQQLDLKAGRSLSVSRQWLYSSARNASVGRGVLPRRTPTRHEGNSSLRYRNEIHGCNYPLCPLMGCTRRRDNAGYETGRRRSAHRASRRRDRARDYAHIHVSYGYGRRRSHRRSRSAAPVCEQTTARRGVPLEERYGVCLYGSRSNPGSQL